MQATSIGFKRLYGDGNGVEFGVSFDGFYIEFEHINKVYFPVEELDWLIAALQRIKKEVPQLQGRYEGR